LETIGYGRILAPSTDPIEKKPFFHVLPGSQAFSVAQLGCNFRCEFCQNYRISQREFISDSAFKRLKYWSGEEVIRYAKDSGCQSVACTFSEPTVWQDYMLECAKEAKQAGLKTLMVSNGAFTPESLERFAPWVDGVNIDLKGDSRVYKELCHANIEPVLESIRAIQNREGMPFLEVTTLVIPEWVSPTVLDEIHEFLISAGVQVWHLTRFVPRYRSRVTDATNYHQYQELIKRFQLQKQVPYIYEDFYPSSTGLSTRCHACGLEVINREGFAVIRNRLDRGACPSCGASIPGVYS
jgi:pyruvate formate lyase activating enzyme